MMEKTALIIEPIKPIGILIEDFLKRLGISEIHQAHRGIDGERQFTDLLKNENLPLVFVDYNLPDIECSILLQNILFVEPRTKIILTTSKEPSDDSIKSLVGLGIRDYLLQPIKFEELKKIFENFKEENNFNKVDEDFVEMMKERLQHLNSINLIKLSQAFQKNPSEMFEILENFKRKGELQDRGIIKIVACNKCSSNIITQMFQCPSCKGNQFKPTKLIEHYDCGNISPEDTYHEEKCPQCKKEIKALGVDFKVLNDLFVCDNCNEQFPEPLLINLCLICNNEFKVENAKWVSDRLYVRK